MYGPPAVAGVAWLLLLLLRKQPGDPDCLPVPRSHRGCGVGCPVHLLSCWNFVVEAMNHEDRQWQDGSLCSSDAVRVHMALVLKGPVKKASATLNFTRSYVKKLPKLDDTSAQDFLLHVHPGTGLSEETAGWAIRHRAGA